MDDRDSSQTHALVNLIEQQQVEMHRIIGEIEEGDINSSTPSDESGGTYETEVDKLVKLINEVQPSLSSDFCISRVPENIREINTKAYDPRVISIGPFHHGNVRYKSMEVYKMRYLKRVVQRSTTVGVPLKKYVQFLKDHETKIRESYSENIEMDSNAFLTMLLLDSCFIIELLFCWWDISYRDVDYSILTSQRLCNGIMLDLILFENQIPFFVLEGLFSLAVTGLRPIPLIRIVIDFFGNNNPQMKSENDIQLIKHFTDLILIFYRPMHPREAAAKVIQVGTKTMTELDEVGIKLKMSSNKCLLDITFSDGILEIPRIMFMDRTETVFRNMMALELCYYFDHSYLIDYLFFLDNVVNTPKDVDLLVKSGIIDNWLGDSKQVADIINNMNKNMVLNDRNYLFSTLSTELNAYCEIPRHKWRAALKRDYFSSPWRGAATIAAIFLLVFTLIQTILSIVSAFRGK